jgi:hypothetical protein
MTQHLQRIFSSPFPEHPTSFMSDLFPSELSFLFFISINWKNNCPKLSFISESIQDQLDQNLWGAEAMSQLG